jgi:hypothetical protein
LADKLRERSGLREEKGSMEKKASAEKAVREIRRKTVDFRYPEDVFNGTVALIS